MTATTTSGTRSVLGRRPVLLPVAAAALAWVGLIAVHGWSSLRVPAGGIGPAGHSGHGDLLTVSGLVDVALMTTAMMAPLAIGAVREVATGSRSHRAGRSIGWFFLAYLGTWTVIAGCLQPVAGLLDGVLGPSVAAGLLVALCALAEFDPHRADRTKSGERAISLPGKGFSADVDCVRFGVLIAGCGVRLCVLPMLAMLAVPGSLLVMALLTALAVADRVTGGRRRLPLATAYGALAVVLLLI